jgi:DNA-binding NarL/FixJ family response regulator
LAVALRLVLAEDDYLLREGLRQLLETVADVEVAAVAEDYDGLLAAVERVRPDVVLTDIRMPPGMTDEGIRAAEIIRSTCPEAGVVVLSQYAEAEYALALLSAGAAGRGYLLKERVHNLTQLVDALKQVAAGGSVIDPKVVETLVAARAKQANSPIQSLTPREREVLAQVAEGKNNAGIAKTLFLTERAVEKHINSIFSKLQLSEEVSLHRRVKAALIYLSQGSQPTT